MAWSVAIIDQYNVGNKRVHVLSCVADAATQAVVTGLDVIDHFMIVPQSVSTAGNLIAAYANSNASGVEAFGTIGMSAATSGDEIYIYAYGR